MNSKRIQGDIQGPAGAPEHEREDKVDPEKFRKVMKVDASDESQKRQKRNLKREEEEGEDEEQVQGKSPSPPSSSFSEFMSDKEELDNVLNSESGGIRRQKAPEEGVALPKPPAGAISTEGVELEEEEGRLPGPAEIVPPPTTPPPSEQPPTEGAPLYEGLAEEEPPVVSQPQQPAGEGIEVTPAEEKKKKADASLLAAQPKRSELKVKKKKKKRVAPKEKIIPAEPRVKKEAPLEPAIPVAAEKAEPLAAPIPAKEGVKEAAVFRRMSPSEVRLQRMKSARAKAEREAAIEGVPVSQPEEGGAMGKKREREEGGFIEASELNASMALPVSAMPLSPITPSEITPSYSTLTPEVYELFEKMCGVMIIQQHSGITTTTITINMPGSIYNDAKIVLDQYSTAPRSFNVQLIGTPEAVKAFRAHLPQLQQSFKQANYGFDVNLLNPILSTRKPSPRALRRKHVSRKRGGQGGKRGKR